jgi:hypothetical protein
MTDPAPGDAEPGKFAAPPADPTLRVEPPPVPGRAARAEMADGSRVTPPFRTDDPTVTVAVPGKLPKGRQRTLEFGAPPPVKVTVGPRPRARRRHRTWPWILAVVLALVVVGATLLVMLLRGQTLDGSADVLGAGPQAVVLAPEVGGP